MEQNYDSRLKEFRQLRRDIRGSREHLVIGIDVAKDRHHAFFGMSIGKTLLRRLIFDNTKEGFKGLCVHADTLKTQHTLKKIVFGLEPTADYHKPLAEYLTRHGFMVVLVGGVAVKKNRELLDGRWDKNDTKDAANVADLIAQGKCLFYDLPSSDIQDIRNLLSLKRRLKKQEQGYKVRIRNHLIAQCFPEMDDYFSYSEGPAIVKWCLNPKEIAALPFEEFLPMVSSRRIGEKQRKRLWEIYNKAASSIGCEVIPSVPFEATTLLKELQNLHGMIEETDKKLEEVCVRFPEYACLLSIPGFGPDISSKVLGAIGDPHRFENQRQVLKMAGLDLSKIQTGKSETIPVISKKGKADLRYGLYQAALIASTRNHRFITYFGNKLKGREREKGIKTKMRIKLAAKMLVIAWTLMKKKEMFDPERIEE
ncbi:MAG: IS110 family transposase [Syntrophus sp. (in: bacteria)]|nr:IS110 family transposase [Syntrophus sp. (in: bacteria)]